MIEFADTDALDRRIAGMRHHSRIRTAAALFVYAVLAIVVAALLAGAQP